ncbi:tetratricopeptide repeat protein [Nonomuraea sp. NPDC051941]|uniref:tetratricopeptide repeat protein n=1 Tax=Nonomuraea sp. NPDC051941 TaxID=3364373 RepID=UPI0037CAB456
MTASSFRHPREPDRQRRRWRWRRVLAWTAVVVSLALLVLGLVAFFSGAGHGPTAAEDVLDKRASVISMFVGIAGLLVAGAALWAQVRSATPAQPGSPSPTSGGSSSGPGSLAVGAMSGGVVVGQVSDTARVSSAGSTAAEAERAIAVAGSNYGAVMSGDHATAFVSHGSLVMGDVLPSRPPLPPAEQTAGLRAPVGLPRRPVAGFTGRAQALEEMRGTLTAGRSVGVISQAVVGLGGVGKSELALQYAHRYGDGYRLVWWIDADSPAQIQAGLAGLTRSLVAGVDVAAAEQATIEEAQGWALTWLSTHTGWLVIFDNVEQVDDVEPYLARLTRGHALITTRRDIGWRDLGITPLRLGLLDRAASIDLLTGLLGPFATGQESLLNELADQLGDLPLALTQAGAYIARTPRITVRRYLELLNDTPARMHAASPAGEAEQVVATVWTVSCRRISEINPLAARLLNLLACYAPDHLPCTVLDGLDDADDVAIGEALALLASYSLITLTISPGDGPVGEPVDLISMHRLIQATTLAQLTDQQQHATQQQAAALLQAALPNDPERLANWPVYRALLPHARAVLPLDSPGLRQVCDYLEASGDPVTALDIQRQVHDHHLHASGAEHPDTLSAQNQLAHWMGLAGDAAGARDQFAALLSIRERVLGAEHPDTLITRHNLAYWMGLVRDAAGARDQFAALLSICERVLGAEHPGTLPTRSQLAYWTGLAGDAAGARDQFAALLPICERVLGAEHPGTLTTRYHLARWTGEAGDAAGARDQFAALLLICERVLGAEHPDTLTTQSQLAYWTGEAGDAARN